MAGLQSKHRDLQVVNFKKDYDTYEDSPIDEFLIPALRNSVKYERAVGFFSSAILTVLAEAFTDFAESGGKMNLICSPVLSFTDAEILESLSLQQQISSLNESLNKLDEDGLAEQPLNLMAGLIRSGCLTLKIAIPFDPGAGMFHQKIGMFTDSVGNRVAFSGSNNESISGWLDMKNSESFFVFRSWLDANELERVDDFERKIGRMWQNQYKGFDVLDFSDSLEFIDRRSTEDSDLGNLKEGVREWYEARKRHNKESQEGGLYQYQIDALKNWRDCDYNGVICFATGTGKTRTAIEALDNWREEFDKRSVIVLVPTTRLQKQWLRELRKNPRTKDLNILLAGGQAPADRWRKALSDATEFKRHADDGIVIAVMDTASEESFYGRVNWGRHILLVADEVHNLGAPGFRNLLGAIDAGAVLGLSATPNRYNDDENEVVRAVFGNDMKPIVDIPYAQSLGVLVPYRYRFQTVGLSSEETEEYGRLTRLIGRAHSEVGDGESDSRLQVLRAQRANVLKNAVSKTHVSASLIKREFRPGQSWIIFCNDKEQLTLLKQEIVELEPLDYHGAMEGDPDVTLQYFEDHGGILLSIHMLDEGVDIPSIDHCLLIASSQNMRQFIQRRGRVLRVDRKNPKALADIWDLIVVNDDGKAFVEAEVTRAEEFGSMALNRSIVYELQKIRPEDDIINPDF
jgi:superfamily II DNA or RNA helicase